MQNAWSDNGSSLSGLAHILVARLRSRYLHTETDGSMLLLSTPLHQRAASRVQHPNHVAANSLSPQVARKGSTLSGFVQRSRLEREVSRDLHSNKWEEV